MSDQVRYREAHNLHVPVDYTDVHGQRKSYWRKLQSDDILKFFKVGGKNGNGPIPPDHTDSGCIGDTWVYIRSQDGIQTRDRLGGKRRVVAVCKYCEFMVCAGHLDQHQRGRECKRAKESY